MTIDGSDTRAPPVPDPLAGRTEQKGGSDDPAS
jgi:hypothetical protein